MVFVAALLSNVHPFSQRGLRADCWWGRHRAGDAGDRARAGAWRSLQAGRWETAAWPGASVATEALWAPPATGLRSTV